MKRLALFILAAFMFAQLPLSAQRNVAERATDKKQIHQGEKNKDRDKAELNEFNAKIAKLESAVKTASFVPAQKIRKSLIIDMEREIAQAEAKTGQARNEVNQSRNEVRHEKNEIRRDVRAGRPGRAVRDVRDKRDDQRDLADDKKDFSDAASRLMRQKAILKQVRSRPALDGLTKAEVSEQMSLIKDFRNIMVEDLRATKREIIEDKGEIREDRRETRDDRRR